MQVRRIRRLLSFRQRLEGMAMTALEQALEQWRRAEKLKAACETAREKEEFTVAGVSSSSADEVRRAYDYIFQLDLASKRLTKEAEKELQKVEQRREALLEARRNVRQIEMLLEREQKKERYRDQRREQAMLDAFAIRAHTRKSM